MEKNPSVSWYISLEIFSALNQSTKTRVCCNNLEESIISKVLILCSFSFMDASWLLTLTNGDFLWKKDYLYVHTAYSFHLRGMHKNLGEFISRCIPTHIFSNFICMKFSLQEKKLRKVKKAMKLKSQWFLSHWVRFVESKIYNKLKFIKI